MTWTGQRRPKHGQPPRRLADPVKARWLQWPESDLNTDLMMHGEGSTWSQAVLDDYKRAWDKDEKLRLAAAQQARLEEIRSRVDAQDRRRHHLNLIDIHGDTGELMMRRLATVPKYWKQWWVKLETWIEAHPPQTYPGTEGDYERKLDSFATWTPPVTRATPGPKRRPKRGAGWRP